MFLMRGMLYAEIKNYERAIRDLTGSLTHLQEFRLKGRPSDFFKSQNWDSAEIMHMRAFLYSEVDSIRQAASDYRYLDSVKPNEFFYTIAVARLYINRKMYDSAQAEIDRIKRNDPNSERALVHQAILYYELGKYEQALADIDTTLQKHPSSIQGMIVKANVLAKLNRREEACKIISEAALKKNLDYFGGQRGYLRDFEKEIEGLVKTYCK